MRVQIGILSGLHCEGSARAHYALVMSLESVCYMVKVSACTLHVRRVKVNGPSHMHVRAFTTTIAWYELLVR
jgi:hypothetical protein